MRISILNNKCYIHNTKEGSNILINDKIFDEEMFEYRIIDRRDFIDDLINWISECGVDRENDKKLMKEDLKCLMNVDDDYIFSSLYTNEYVISSDVSFKETCQKLLGLNKEVK